MDVINGKIFAKLKPFVPTNECVTGRAGEILHILSLQNQDYAIYRFFSHSKIVNFQLFFFFYYLL